MVKSLIGWASWESNFLFPKLFACHVWSAALGHHCCPSLPLMRADELVLRDTIWTGLPPSPLPQSFPYTSDSCVARKRKRNARLKNPVKDDHFFKWTLNVLLKLQNNSHLIVEVGKGVVTKIRGIIWLWLIWDVLTSSMFLPFLASCSIRLHWSN